MKRKLNGPETDRPSGRRQPQVSCDFCRKKKLKCDRGRPCTNCSVRRLPCGHQETSTTCTDGPDKAPSGTVSPRGLVDEPGILARLQRLEDLIFGAAAEGPAPVDSRFHDGPAVGGGATNPQETSAAHARSGRRGLSPTTDSERQRKARSLDLTFTKHHHQMPLRDSPITYRIAGTPSSSITATNNTPESFTDNRSCQYEAKLRPHINMMTREDALLLLHNFVHNPLHLLPVLHEPTVCLLIHKVYDDIDARPVPKSPKPAHAALVLSLAAIGASFYHDGCSIARVFPGGEDEASEATMVWLHSAMDLLDQSQRAAFYCLEDVQARVILMYVFYNMEGCSSRIRFLHRTSVFIANELGLHLTDSPKAKQEGEDDKITKEIKRRLWWYIVATDWMLGFLGGPLDGTYSILPRHMNVRQPRNINDRDLDTQDDTFTHPDHVPTDMSFLVQRTRVAEVCRLALDARPAGLPDEDSLDTGAALQLDGLFQDMLNTLPQFFQPDGVIPAGAPRCLELHRDTILLAIHARRARMHRRHLLSNHHQQDDDPGSQTLRERCLESTRTVISVAMKMLDTSYQTPLSRHRPAHAQQPTSPLARRMGIVVGHLFMGCAMLVLQAGHGNGGGCADAPRTRDQKLIRRACQGLTEAGRSSPIAASLVRDLTRVVRQYSLQGGGGEESESRRCEGSERAMNGPADVPAGYCPGAASGANDVTASSTDRADMEIGGELLLSGEVAGPEHGGADPWADLLLGTMVSTETSWDELFSGLDSYCDGYSA